MSRSARLRAVAVALVFLVLLVGAASAAPGGRVLVVESADTGERVFTAPVDDGTPVALEYTHSVERTRVLDAYVVRGDTLVMTRMEFESYGWGLPARANVSSDNGTFVFDPEGRYEELYVTPGDVARHKLHVGERTYDLYDAVGEQSVRLHIERRSALNTALDILS